MRVRGKAGRELLLSIIGGREVSDGANLVVIDAGSKKLRCGKGDEQDALLASPLQVYLDLLEDRGRSTEIAEELRSQKLVWQ